MRNSGCDHLSVLITRIVRAWSGTAQSRMIGGRCQNCEVAVQRADDGVTITSWEAAQ